MSPRRRRSYWRWTTVAPAAGAERAAGDALQGTETRAGAAALALPEREPDRAPYCGRAGGGPARMILEALVVFAGALLLFLVEPLIARMLLPLFGGTAAVW